MIQFALAVTPLLAFYGYCLLFGRKGYCRQESVMFLVSSSLVVTLFFSAWLGILWQVTFLLIAFGVAITIYETKIIFLIVRPGMVLKEAFVSPIMLHLVMTIALLAILTLNKAELAFWDDFTHWAVVSKDIFTRDAFPVSVTGAFFGDYPPGTALFHYFFLFANGLNDRGVYSEQLAMWAQGILVISSGCMLLSHALKRGPLYSLLIFLTALFAVFTYTDGFLTLMVDHVIGVYFAACVICIVLDENDERWLPVVSLGTVALSLFKLNAEFFSLAVIALALTNLCFRSAERTKGRKVRFFKDELFVRGSLVLALAVILIFTCKWMWGNHIESQDVERAFRVNNSTGSMVSWVFNPTENEKNISTKFFNAMVPGVEKSFEETRKSVTNNPFKIALLPIVLLSVLVVCIGEDRVRLGVLTAVIYAGFLLFCIGLLFFYQRSFDFNVAVHLSSFGRYLSHYFLAIVFLAFGLILNACASNKSIGFSVSLMLISSIFLMNPIPATRLAEFLGLTESNKQILRATRSKYSEFLNEHSTLRRDSTRTVLIWQCANGIESLLMSYDLYPANVGRIPNLGPECGSTGSVGKEVFEGFPFDKYDYLIVAQSNEWFSDTFADRFPLLEPDSKMQLYKITSQSGRAIFTLQ